MSLNSAHVLNGGVLIYAGERIILFCRNVKLDFDKYGECAAMRGDKLGRLFLTTHRLIFVNDQNNDALRSFSFPFCTLNKVELEQPVFGANYISGYVRNQPGGGFSGDVRFKLVFKDGGCIVFGQAMLTAAKMANRHTQQGYAPPPYMAPEADSFYPAPPPAYSPPQQGYYGWVPPYNVFQDQPTANSVYVHDLPPPYPGVTGFASAPVGSAAVPSAPDAGFYQPPPPPPIGFYNAQSPQTAFVAPAPYPNAPPPAYREKSD